MRAFLEGASRWLALVCRWVAGGCLILMLAVTIADVVTRYLQRLTDGAIAFQVFGSVELVSYLMLFSLLAAMSASVEKSQVVVEAFSHRLPATIAARLHGVYLLGFTVLGGVLATGLVGAAHAAVEYGEVTQDLRISLGPIYLIAAGLSALLAARSLLHALLGGLFAQSAEVSHGD